MSMETLESRPAHPVRSKATSTHPRQKTSVLLPLLLEARLSAAQTGNTLHQERVQQHQQGAQRGTPPADAPPAWRCWDAPVPPYGPPPRALCIEPSPNPTLPTPQNPENCSSMPGLETRTGCVFRKPTPKTGGASVKQEHRHEIMIHNRAQVDGKSF